MQKKTSVFRNKLYDKVCRVVLSGAGVAVWTDWRTDEAGGLTALNDAVTLTIRRCNLLQNIELSLWDTH